MLEVERGSREFMVKSESQLVSKILDYTFLPLK